MNTICRGISQLAIASTRYVKQGAAFCCTLSKPATAFFPRIFYKPSSLFSTLRELPQKDVLPCLQNNLKQFHLKQLNIFGSTSLRLISLLNMHRRGPRRKRPKKMNPIGENKPYAKAVVLRTLIKKPKKPNSANRKCVLVRLSTGKELVAFVPGIGHNLQEHNVVLVRPGRLRDTPGVKIRCVRGALDLPHVVKKST